MPSDDTNADETRRDGAIDLLDKALDYAFQIVYPNACLLCGAPTPSPRRDPLRLKVHVETVLCPECRAALVAPDGFFCRYCGAPAHKSPEDAKRCRAIARPYAEAQPLQLYRGTTRRLVLRLKSERTPTLARAAATIYYEAKREALEAFAPSCVVAAPMYWLRRLARGGINAPETIAAELARRLGVPALTNRLRRARSTAPQTAVPWDWRRENVRGAFAVARPLGFLRGSRDLAPFENQRVALVDDAFTSGATSSEIARTLLEAGAESVFVAALARGGLARGRR